MVEELSDVVISFVGDSEADGGKIQIAIYPFSHEIYLRVTLTGHGKSVIRGRRWPPHKLDKGISNTDGLQVL